MARTKKNSSSTPAPDPTVSMGDFTADLIKTLNKEAGDRIAYNLAVDDAPTNVRRWISTGSTALDYIISNKRDGGIPEGRITEIYGPPSIGKSHIALQVAKSAQQMGGMVVLIDSENATNIELLEMLGIDVKNNFVYVEETCTENVFSIMERTIMRSREVKKDVPIVIIWDSVAACSPKAELMGDYDQETIGLQARQLAKGFRKITNTIGANRITLLLLNQMKTKIGVLHGDPDVTPGGAAIPFHASVRVKLTSGTQVKDRDGQDVIGINVIATTVKNKVAAPRRKANFEIHFGRGIVEHEQLFNVIRQLGPVWNDGKIITCGGNSTWKVFSVSDAETGEVEIEKKFYKHNFNSVMSDPQYRDYITALLDRAFIKKLELPTLESELQAEIDLHNQTHDDKTMPVAGVTGA